MPSTVWKGTLTFGLVTIPVRLHKAARRERVKFHHVYHPERSSHEIVSEPIDEEPSLPPRARSTIHELPAPTPAAPAAEETVVRVRNLAVGELSEKPVPTQEVLKGYEIEPGRYVTFQPAELAAVRAQTSTELTVAEFVRLAEIDPIYFETSYYAAPDRGGEKPYALLHAALTKTNYAAIGSLAMHGREHATVIRAGQRGLILHTLFYQNEVRAEEEYQSDPKLANAKELELAETVIRAWAAPFDASKLKDTFEQRLRALIDSRAETAVPAHEPGATERPARPVPDIMEALRKSLEMARKPPKREAEPRPGEVKVRKNRGRRAGS